MFTILNISNKSQWRSCINKLPTNVQDIYYSPEYYALYENIGDGIAKCFFFEQSDEIVLYPFLLNSINDLGYKLDNEYFDIQGAYGYNGIISSTNNESFIAEFYKAFDGYCTEHNIIAEFTRFHPVLNNYKLSEKNLTTFFDRETVILDLENDYDTIWKEEYSSKNKNMVRKADKNGVQSFISQNKKDYNYFFELYYETMQNVGASDYYFFNRDYFESIRKDITGHHFLIVSKIGNEIVGGMILFIYGEYAHYHLSARKREFGKYAISNHFLDFAIKVAKKQGCKSFHFGGGNCSNEKDSLFKFKSNFSKQRGQFYFGKKIHNQNIYNDVVAQWENLNPQKKEKLRNYTLKYRY